MSNSPDALCSKEETPDLWFSERKAAVQLAKSICNRCDIRQQCLSDALEYEALGQTMMAGVLGGMTPQERGKLRRRTPQLTS